MKDKMTMKKIEEVAKELKLSHAAFWMSKATRMQLDDKQGYCILMYIKQSCCDNMQKYIPHAKLIFKKMLSQDIEVKAICVGHKDIGCRK